MKEKNSDNNHSQVVLITQTDIDAIKEGITSLRKEIAEIRRSNVKSGINPSYISAQKFMDAVDIRRWKFNQLIANNLIKTRKKKRKIYVLASEVDRYFSDPKIQ